MTLQGKLKNIEKSSICLTELVLLLRLSVLKFLSRRRHFTADNGAVAQLGERLHGMQEVEGSNPFSSIFFI